MTVSERCQSFVADIRRKLKSLTDKYPALVLLCGLINGLLPMTFMPDKPATIKILYCLPALLTVFLLPDRQECFQGESTRQRTACFGWMNGAWFLHERA